MRCGEKERELALYVAGELDPARTSSLEAHLSLCPKCAESERALRKNAEALRELSSLRLEHPMEEAFHRRVMAVLRHEKGATQARAPWSNGRAAMRLALAACLLIGLVAGAAYMLTRESRPAPRPFERPQVAARRDGAPPAIVPPVSPDAAHQAVVKVAPPTSASPVHAHFQMAKRTPHAKEMQHEEALVIRLQTDDPEVVIYWQLQNRGG